MPRPRTKDKDLPKGVYRHGKHYRLRIYDDEGTPGWQDLGKDKDQAIKEWQRLMGTRSDTVSDLMDRYLLEVMPTKGESTRKGQTRQMGVLRKVFGNMRPKDLQTRHGIEYLDKRGNISANREMALLRHLMTKARHWGKVEHNPFTGLQYRNPEPPRDREVTDADLCHGLHCRHVLIRRAIWIVYLTGLRRSDVLSLTSSQLTEDGILVTENKTGKRALIGWSESLRRVCCRLLRESPDGRLFPIGSSGFDSAWQRWWKGTPKAERWQLKDVRARHASDFELSGGNATKQLGHSSRAVTIRHYLRKPRSITPIR